MVKNLPTVERSTKIRFGKNCTDDQGENTIVFNASNVQIDTSNPGSIYMTPLSIQANLYDTNVTMLTYNTYTKEVINSNVLASDVLNFNLQDVTENGNTSNISIHLANTQSLTTSGNVSISNTTPQHTLDVGSNLYVDDTGTDILHVTGNANVTNKLTTNDLRVNGDARVYGNLDVVGTLTTLRTENTTIDDAIIEIGANNTVSSTLDTGIIMTRPGTSVGLGFRGDESEFMIGFTQSDASDVDLVPDTSNLIQTKIYGDLHVSNAFNVATRAQIGSNVIIDDDAPHAISVTGNAYTSRAILVGSNVIVDDLAENALRVTGNTYTSRKALVGANVVIDDLSSNVVELEGNLYASEKITIGDNITLHTNAADEISVEGNIHASRKITVGPHITLDTLGSNVISVVGNTYTSRAAIIGSNVVIDDLASDVVTVIGDVYVSNAIDVGSNVVVDDLASDVVSVTGNTYTSRKLTVGSNVIVDDLASDVVVVTGNVSVSKAIDIGSNVVIDDLASDVVAVTGNVAVSKAIDIGSNVVIDDLASDAISVTGNTHTSRKLTVGSNVIVDDLASDALTVTGNVSVSKAIDIGSNVVIDDLASDVLTVTGNVSVSKAIDIGSNVVIDDLASDVVAVTGNVSVSKAIDIGSNVVIDDLASNALAISGNMSATEVITSNVMRANTFIGDGGILSNVTLQVVSDHGNATSNTIRFTNPTTALTTDLTSNVGVKLDQLANVVLTNYLNEDMLVYDGSNWVNQKQNHTFLYAKAAVALSKGDVVYATGAVGNDTFVVDKADARDPTKMPALGVVYQDLAQNGQGLIVTFGRADSIPLDSFIEGETVYVSNTVPGGLSNLVPHGEINGVPNLIQNIGIVVKPHVSQGIVSVTGVGRTNAIPNANVITQTPAYVYTDGSTNQNTLHKIVPANLLTKLQTLEQVVNTGNTVANTINVTGLTTTGNVSVGSNISVTGLADPLNKYLPMVDTDGTLIRSPVLVNETGKYVITASEAEFLGNITLSGNTTIISSTSVTIGDRIFGVGANNSATNLDTGFMIEHQDGNTYANVALIYHATDHKFSIGYTQNTFTDDHILNFTDSNHVMLFEIDGNALVQNNITVASGGTYYGDGRGLSNVTLQQVSNYGNTTSNTIQFTNADTSLVTTGKVGIANSSPAHDLSIGSNVYVDDDGVNVISVTGNVSATRFIGDGSFLENIASNLHEIVTNGNETNIVVKLQNTTSLTTTGSVGIANSSPGHDLSIGSNVYVDDDGVNVISVTGNVSATRFIGDGSFLENLASNLHEIVTNGNETNIVVKLQNTTSLTTTGSVGISNSSPGHDLSIGSNVYVDDDGVNVISVTGNVSATRFIGDGSFLENLASNLHEIVTNGNETNIVVKLQNTTSLTTTGSVGISNSSPGHDLSIGSNVYVDDDGVNVISVTGNVSATRFIGDGSFLENLASNLHEIVTNGNETNIVVKLQNTTSLVTTGNVGISNSSPGHDLSIGSNVYVDDDGANVIVVTGNVSATRFIGDSAHISNVTVNTIGISNLTPEHDLSIGSNVYVDDDGANVINVTGNVSATRFIGDGSFLENIASRFEEIIINGNVTSNTVEFKNATSIVTTGSVGISNITPNHDLSVGSNLYVDDDSSNVLYITGNEFMGALTLGFGEATIQPSYGLHHVTETYNQTSDTIILTNATKGLDVTSNIEIGGSLKFDSNVSIPNMRVADFATNVVTYDAITGELTDSGGLISNKFAIISEQPPIALTGASTAVPSHGTYASTTSSSDAYKAFDKTSTHWSSDASYTGVDNVYDGVSELFSGGELGDWIKIELPYKTTLRHISVTPAVSVASFPGYANVYASNDGISWSEIKNWSATTPSSVTDIKKFAVNASAAYSKYALVATQAAGNSTSVNVGEWRLFTESFTIDGGVMNTTAQISLDNGIQSNLEVGTANIFVDVTTSNVGVGTNAPLARLDVRGDVRAGALAVTDTTQATSITTGALTVAGGISTQTNVHAANVYISGGLITNTAGVTKKTYSYSGDLPNAQTIADSTIKITFSNHVFYAKIVAHLVESDDEVSTIEFKCGGGNWSGTTPANSIAVGPVSVFGGTSTNPWSSVITATATTVAFKPTTNMAAAGHYNVFIEYISQSASGAVSKITEGTNDEITFAY